MISTTLRSILLLLRGVPSKGLITVVVVAVPTVYNLYVILYVYAGRLFSSRGFFSPRFAGYYVVVVWTTVFGITIIIMGFLSLARPAETKNESNECHIELCTGVLTASTYSHVFQSYEIPVRTW